MWLILILAGVLEAVWAVGLKYTEGFTRLWPSVAVAATIAASMVLLGIATRELPIGTAYAVWVGVGTVGAFIGGVVLFDEAATPGRLFFLALLLIAIVGLKVTGESGGA